jgi:hypothetical protein
MVIGIARSIGAPAPSSVGGNCYLTARCLPGHGRFERFIVHEAAHVVHNGKGATVGLLATRT